MAQPAAEPEETVAEPPEIDEAATARINLRLPERLKEGVEEAAARERQSVNSWLVRAIASARGAERASAVRQGADRPVLHRMGALNADL